MLSHEDLQQLYEQHGAALVLYARQWSNAPDDALQEAMMELTKLKQSPKDVLAWLYAATKRRSMNIARAEKRRLHHQSAAAESKVDWFDCPTFDASRAELGPRVAAGLEQLEAEEREVVVARVWGGLTFEQIGQLVGCSSSAAHRRFLAALEKLRTYVAVDEPYRESACAEDSTGK